MARLDWRRRVTYLPMGTFFGMEERQAEEEGEWGERKEGMQLNKERDRPHFAAPPTWLSGGPYASLPRLALEGVVVFYVAPGPRPRRACAVLHSLPHPATVRPSGFEEGCRPAALWWLSVVSRCTTCPRGAWSSSAIWNTTAPRCQRQRCPSHPTGATGPGPFLEGGSSKPSDREDRVLGWSSHIDGTQPRSGVNRSALRYGGVRRWASPCHGAHHPGWAPGSSLVVPGQQQSSFTKSGGQAERKRRRRTKARGVEKKRV
ncbi:hypothetical protein GQ53DRAFT_79865 [Thozetella sp. PMI_491]|nr:hypothetical protein GQ53DRAFT_79865 [Thozetella sp. PMI_491]